MSKKDSINWAKRHEQAAEEVVQKLKEDAPNNKRKAYVLGVYCLYFGDDIVYVGQSRNIYGRISQHMNGAPFEFDHFIIKECEPFELRLLEAKLIQELQPKWNKILPAYNGVRYATQKIHYAKE